MLYQVEQIHNILADKCNICGEYIYEGDQMIYSAYYKKCHLECLDSLIPVEMAELLNLDVYVAEKYDLRSDDAHDEQ